MVREVPSAIDHELRTEKRPSAQPAIRAGTSASVNTWPALSRATNRRCKRTPTNKPARFRQNSRGHLARRHPATRVAVVIAPVGSDVRRSGADEPTDHDPKGEAPEGLSGNALVEKAMAGVHVSDVGRDGEPKPYVWKSSGPRWNEVGKPDT